MPLVPKTKAKSPGDERQEAISEIRRLWEQWSKRHDTNTVILWQQLEQRLNFALARLWDCMVVEKMRQDTCSNTEAAALLHLAFDMAERDA
jgi:hypothetical protein